MSSTYPSNAVLRGVGVVKTARRAMPAVGCDEQYNRRGDATQNKSSALCRRNFYGQALGTQEKLNQPQASIILMRGTALNYYYYGFTLSYLSWSALFQNRMGGRARGSPLAASVHHHKFLAPFSSSTSQFLDYFHSSFGIRSPLPRTTWQASVWGDSTFGWAWLP